MIAKYLCSKIVVVSGNGAQTEEHLQKQHPSVDEDTQLMLLHYDDDTFKTVWCLPDNKLHILETWHDDCDETLNFEKIDANIEHGWEGLYDKILFTSTNTSLKIPFVNKFIPAIISMATLAKDVAEVEMTDLCLPKKSVLHSAARVLKRNQTLDDLNIIVPDKLKHNSYYYHNNNNNIVFLPPHDFTETNSTKYIESVIDKEMSFNIPELKAAFHKEYNTTDLSANYTFACDENSSDWTVVPYNAEFDALHAPFGTNCLPLLEVPTMLPTDLPTCSLVSVIFNLKKFTTLVITDPDIDTFDLIKNHSEFGFIELFSACLQTAQLKATIQTQYHKSTFNNIDELNNALMTTAQYIELFKSKQPNQDEYAKEQTTVLTFLKCNYSFTTDINCKMKASVLANIVVEESGYKIDKTKMPGFINRLSQYLKTLGLQKKRYNDGYYYYGITRSNWYDAIPVKKNE